MVKKDNTIRGIRIIVFLGLSTLIILSTLWIYSQMPKEICHTEYNIDKIVLDSIEFKDYHWTFILYQEFSDYCKSFSGEITCEDGVTISSGAVCNYGIEDKICLVKESKEICEVIYQ